jgi:hypothetical protein
MANNNEFNEQDINDEGDDMQNELNYLRARRQNGEELDPDELLMIGLIED